VDTGYGSGIDPDDNFCYSGDMLSLYEDQAKTAIKPTVGGDDERPLTS